MAKPGYGKRNAPDQQPPRPGDFDHLPAREAYLAGLLDQLCENAAMDAKTMAKAQPLYGQQAVRSGFNELGRFGHLRRVRRRVEPADGSATGTRWVFYTYWSRTARDNEWWARFLEGDASAVTAQSSLEPPAEPSDPADPGDVPPPVDPPQSHDRARPSTAYATLARLGLREPRLALSSADCAALEQSAAEWLDRGATPDQLTQVLVAALPERVYAPGAFVRRRLVDKMPPEQRPTAEPSAPRVLMECTDCGVPGRPEALPGGLCRGCRQGVEGDTTELGRMRHAAVHARVAEVRASMRAPQPV
ncbi:hypothetical protein [Streptomyces cellulosae]|uniref:hypothetical protein n=1 Tax=Streptomyces cellulosae TaxID=1968 RepID=UPI000B240E46|nr:hypothetical protein [Streptomyces cellulosae]